MTSYNPKELEVPKLHQLLLGGIGPRPIALVSTISEDGILNLTPFSFFNCFGSNPPMVAFSPSRRGKDGSFKNTYHNLMNNKECVVQSVTYSMVNQINLASAEFAPEVDEFVKSGLTPVDSEIVKPKRVKESPFQMECVMREMRSFGEGGAAPNIAICEVLKIHIPDDIVKNGVIHPDDIDLVGRMSANYYSRASGEAIFELKQPKYDLGIGYDQLPDFIKKSYIYSANNIAALATCEAIPSDADVNKFIKEIQYSEIENYESGEEAFYRYQRHSDYKRMLKAAVEILDKKNPKAKTLLELTAKCALENNNADFAWKTALYAGKINN
ncbi:MAG TPA: flavin reductase family protein [Ignavibacteriaceae bacterium]|nr:flavin reductase family protein [Ignavibacteriaceae bacterium]